MSYARRRLRAAVTADLVNLLGPVCKEEEADVDESQAEGEGDAVGTDPGVFRLRPPPAPRSRCPVDQCKACWNESKGECGGTSTHLNDVSAQYAMKTQHARNTCIETQASYPCPDQKTATKGAVPW